MIDLTRFSDAQLAAMMRVAKTRLRAFFGRPQAMIALRLEFERRNAR